MKRAVAILGITLGTIISISTSSALAQAVHFTGFYQGLNAGSAFQGANFQSANSGFQAQQVIQFGGQGGQFGARQSFSGVIPRAGLNWHFSQSVP